MFLLIIKDDSKLFTSQTKMLILNVMKLSNSLFHNETCTEYIIHFIYSLRTYSINATLRQNENRALMSHKCVPNNSCSVFLMDK